MMDYEIREQKLITFEEKELMFKLMTDNYSGVTREDFYRDLAGKDYVILLTAEEKICGFSTFKLIQHKYKGRMIRVAFSGDTIVCRENRNSRILPVSFGILMNRIERMSSVPLYWMLISKGFRTYRFLPVYFKEFYPVFNKETPADQAELTTELANHFFGERYDKLTGIIAGNGQTVRDIREDEESINRRPDPHVTFFNEKNTGWKYGDELVCLVRYNEQNLNPFIARRLHAEEVRMEKVAL